MNNINEKIGDTIMKMTPNDFNSIANELNVKPKIKWFQIFKPAYAFSLVLLLAVGVIGFNTLNSEKIYSTISLDVNPSIEINVNAQDKVLSVNAYNQDAKTIIGDMDFKGSSLDITINALIGSLLRHGYLSDSANSILVTVDGKDQNKSKQLQTEIVQEIDEILSGNNIEGAVLSQVLDKNTTIENLSKQYGISQGKATLINDIVNKENSTNTFEELLPLTINELNLIAGTSKVELNHINSQGSASDKSYIGEPTAKANALNYVGINENDIYAYEWELDYEYGVMVYEIEFKANGLEYDIKINALDGTIVHSYSEKDDDYFVSNPAIQQNQNNQNNQNYSKTNNNNSYSYNYSFEQAKTIALNHAGVSDYYDFEIELDDGKYEISFKSGGFEYDYDINPSNGNIIKYEKEWDD